MDRIINHLMITKEKYLIERVMEVEIGTGSLTEQKVTTDMKGLMCIIGNSGNIKDQGIIQ